MPKWDGANIVVRCPQLQSIYCGMVRPYCFQIARVYIFIYIYLFIFAAFGDNQIAATIVVCHDYLAAFVIFRFLCVFTPFCLSIHLPFWQSFTLLQFVQFAHRGYRLHSILACMFVLLVFLFRRCLQHALAHAFNVALTQMHHSHHAQLHHGAVVQDG